MSTPTTTDTLTLYTYHRSSCSARLRIALALKSLPYSSIYISLLPLPRAPPAGPPNSPPQHKTPEYVAINPSGTVPTLIITTEGGRTTTTITQSIAALEYLDEKYSGLGPSLLPRDLGQRARVRELVNIVACDVQPVTNLNILQFVEGLGGDKTAYAREKMRKGLAAYETLLAQGGEGRYSVGEEISMADVVLAPAIWNAERFGVEFGKMPLVRGVGERLMEEEAFRGAHWRRQADCPVELRAKD